MRHLFMSPHFDDAALSCGGLIHQLVQRGEQVLIITVMGGDPPEPPPDTPIVRDLHQRWQAGYNPVIARRQEDACAAQALGAQAEHLPFGDCVYRVNARGVALYPTEESLWGDVQPGDPALAGLGHVAQNLPADVDTIYCPLGAGSHVDHKLVRDWGLDLHRQSGQRVQFYEEYPYTARDANAVSVALRRCV